MSKPNLLLLVIDSLRADAVFGDQVPTPNFDSLARRGASFRQCIATATTTTPAFASLLTGCYPPKHGVRGLQGYRLSRALATMADIFGKAGYHTAAEVTGPLVPETGILRGFEDQRHRPGYRQPWFGWRKDVVAKLAAMPQPWLLLLHLWEVHRPFRPPPDFTKQYDRRGYERAVAATDEWLAPVFGAAGGALVVITGDHGEQYPETSWQQVVNRGVRKTRKTLKPSKWWPSLDVKLASHSVGHGFALFEPLVRVPLIVAGPGAVPATIDQQVRHVDLLPTLAELCGVEVPPGIDGRTLRPLMEGASLPDEPAYMEAVGVKLEGKRISGVRTPDWKLLRTGGARPVLYRLSGSPQDEKRNVYRRHPEIAGRLEAVIEEILSDRAQPDSGMTREEEAVVEQHLRDLGYL